MLTQDLYTHSFKSINYSAESCDYYSFVKFDCNWYEAKKLCGTINAELLGIPSSEECQLVNDCLSHKKAQKSPTNLFLNMHLKMYAKNGSSEIFLDPSGKSINEFNCNSERSLRIKWSS